MTSNAKDEFNSHIIATGGAYAAIAALTNIPATLLAVFIYEVFLTDSDRGVCWF
jgi:hypothetical protein